MTILRGVSSRRKTGFRLDPCLHRAYNLHVTLKERRCAVLAEDEPAILMALDEVLSSQGFTTVPCTDGISALEAIRRKRPALAIFDVNMPRLTGTDVALRLRMVDGMDELRILMITGRDDLRTRRMILSSGSDAFIIKPFDLRNFLKAVNGLLDAEPRQWLQRSSWYELIPEMAPNLEERLPALPPENVARGHADLVASLARSLDERSLHQPYHSVQVAHLAQLVARSLGLDTIASSRIRVAGLVHDLGLLFIPDAIVNIPGKLDEESMARVRQHPIVSAGILAGLPGMEGAVPAVRHHHERWDGSGYPDGLRAEAIPIEARILAVADAFSAMTTRRVYAKPMSLEEASAELDRNAGTQFDPSCVEAFHTASGL